VPSLGFGEGVGALAGLWRGCRTLRWGFSEVQGSLAGLGESRELLLRGRRRWWRRWKEEKSVGERRRG